MEKKPRLTMTGGALAALAAIAALMLLAAFGCAGESGSQTRSEILVASTTSTKDSGLFDELLPAFEQAFPGYLVKVNAVGTGEALKLGENCDADVVLVHAPDSEKKFVASGFGTERREVMYNDFIIVGPPADPAGIGTSSSAIEAFSKITGGQSDFISRGDDSGTHKKELQVWEKSGISPSGAWYQSSGQGMGETLRIANELEAYTLTDRGTWLSQRDRLSGLTVLFEGDQILFNQYGVIPVSPEHCSQVNVQGAADFANWLISPDGQKVIGDYGIAQFGQALFVPNAQ